MRSNTKLQARADAHPGLINTRIMWGLRNADRFCRYEPSKLVVVHATDAPPPRAVTLRLDLFLLHVIANFRNPPQKNLKCCVESHHYTELRAAGWGSGGLNASSDRRAPVAASRLRSSPSGVSSIGVIKNIRPKQFFWVVSNAC